MTDSQPMDATIAVRIVADSLIRTVRMPLHALHGFAVLLSASKMTEEQHSLAHSMGEQADGLAQACDRLTLLLRIAAGEKPGPAQPFTLGELFSRVTATAAPVTPVSVRVHPQLPRELIGDVEALQHLMTELVDNAVTHGRRPITLAADIAGEADGDALPLRITITDSGPGMPQQYLSQLNVGCVDPTGETSLIGLSLAVLLAARLGGRLTAIQRAGGATEIALYLTLRTTEAPDSGPEVRPATGLHVLLIDDNTVNRLLTSRQVARLGHHLDAVATGLDGVRAAADGHYDVILMDRHLPDIDGVEATRQIRAAETADREGTRVSIIAVTADAQPGHREECLAAGMDGFLAKPIDIERLRVAITAAVPGPVATTTGDSEAAVDLAALDRLVREFDGDTRPASELVRTYLDDLPVRLETLRIALQGVAAHDVVAAAASLHAASLTIGATTIARICGRIRNLAQAGDVSAGRAALAELDAASAYTLAELDMSGSRHLAGTR